MRNEYDLPEGQEFSSGTVLAVSPDGKHSIARLKGSTCVRWMSRLQNSYLEMKRTYGNRSSPPMANGSDTFLLPIEN